MPCDVVIDKMKYVPYDYKPAGRPTWDYFFYKSKEYRDEQEVRAAFLSNESYDKVKKNGGLKIPIDIDTLLDGIRLAPSCKKAEAEQIYQCLCQMIKDGEQKIKCSAILEY